eukprot:6204733-Pleurochrysis_carterae.AAC.1
MANMIFIPPPTTGMAAFLERSIVEVKKSLTVQELSEKAAQACDARQRRVKSFLNHEIKQIGSTVPRSSCMPAEVDASSGACDMHATGLRFHETAKYPLLVISIAAGLNILATSNSATQASEVPTIATMVDYLGPSLANVAQGSRISASEMPVHVANIIEMYFIVDTAVRLAPLNCSSLLDAFMLIDRAVHAGYKFDVQSMRQTLVASLSLAHERARKQQKLKPELTERFAARCFPTLNLLSLPATEYFLVRTIDFDLSCLDEKSARQKCVDGLGKVAGHHEEVNG